MKYDRNLTSTPRRLALAPLLAILAVHASLDCQAARHPNMTITNVPSDMFIWKSNYDYETTLHFRFTTTKLTFTGTLSDHNIKGSAPQAVTYDGLLPYKTRFLAACRT